MNTAKRASAVVLAGVVVLFSGACRRPWRLARSEYPITPASLSAAPVHAIPADPALAPGPPVGRLSPDPVPVPPPPPAPVPLPPPSPVGVGGSLSAAGETRWATAGNPPMAPGEPPAGPVFEPVAPVPDEAWYAPRGFRPRFRAKFQELGYHVRTDYENYYSWITMRDLLLGIAGGSILANTSLDEDFQDWYQEDVRSPGTDSFVSFWKPFGEGQIFVPAFAGLAVVGGMFEDRTLFGVAGEFGDRVTRGYLVGAPPMVFMQYCLGASRPGETNVGSRWKPFDDSNGVSGHAFMGAVPFITAAKMTDNPWAKSTFYVFSGFTAWSRVNDDAHYLSQACLGWWMAYLACRAVEDTEREDRQLTLMPLITREAAGVGMVYRR